MSPFWLAILAAVATAACKGGENHDSHAGHTGTAGVTAHGGHDATPPPSGYTAVRVDPARAAAMQLSTAPVEEAELARTLRTVGAVALDETRSAHVHAKVRGWIEGIHVDFVGRRVKPGEPLCSIYSQDVHAAEIEFLSILGRVTAQPASGELAEAEKRAQGQLIDAARRRLSVWDVPKDEIARLEATREAKRTFPLLAPRGGVVVAKQATLGMYVDPSLELYTLSDLSRVWVLADVYEADVPYVHAGDRARLTVEGVDGPIDANVAFLPPTIDEATRTLKVRFELPNPDGRLRPGAFVSAELREIFGRGLTVPESAVIRTGARSIVFVAREEEPGHLEPREIKLGPLVGDRYRVDAGLEAGARVATSAQFLLDSESRLRATSAPGGGHVH